VSSEEPIKQDFYLQTSISLNWGGHVTLIRYEDTADLQVEGESGPLAPGASRDLTIRFSPREARKYLERVPLRIGGCAEPVEVVVKGEGCPLHVEVLTQAQRNANFGSIGFGGQAKLTVKVRLLCVVFETTGPLILVFSLCDCYYRCATWTWKMYDMWGRATNISCRWCNSELTGYTPSRVDTCSTRFTCNHMRCARMKSLLTFPTPCTSRCPFARPGQH
jgi:hypothetical protein